MRRTRRAHDNGSFEQAFDELFVQAIGVAHRLVGDPIAAEDITAEALSLTYARWGSVSERPHRTAWVMRVVVNLAIDHLRRRNWATARADLTWDDPEVIERVALVGALSALPKRQREVLALRRIADLSEKEVAKALRLRPGRVRVHHHDGIQTLRTELRAANADERVRFELV